MKIELIGIDHKLSVKIREKEDEEIRICMQGKMNKKQKEKNEENILT